MQPATPRTLCRDHEPPFSPSCEIGPLWEACSSIRSLGWIFSSLILASVRGSHPVALQVPVTGPDQATVRRMCCGRGLRDRVRGIAAGEASRWTSRHQHRLTRGRHARRRFLSLVERAPQRRSSLKLCVNRSSRLHGDDILHRSANVGGIFMPLVLQVGSGATDASRLPLMRLGIKESRRHRRRASARTAGTGGTAERDDHLFGRDFPDPLLNRGPSWHAWVATSAGLVGNGQPRAQVGAELRAHGRCRRGFIAGDVLARWGKPRSAFAHAVITRSTKRRRWVPAAPGNLDIEELRQQQERSRGWPARTLRCRSFCR